MTSDCLVQVYHSGEWFNAATLLFQEPEKGIGGETSLSYEVAYFTEFAAEESLKQEVVDLRALSVKLPIDLNIRTAAHWPAFLLDLLPQGVARQRLVQTIFHEAGKADSPEVEVPLLLRAAGAPIGNIRIKEAWEQEQERIDGKECPGVTDTQILELDDTFLDVAERFALQASGSSGVQGAWPKVLMTKDRGNGLWYPDPLVADENAEEHAIVKMTRSGHQADTMILASEAPYLEVARQFGLRAGSPLRGGSSALIIPRFDREVTAKGAVIRLGQESLISALGIAQFGAVMNHEKYLGTIKEFVSDPASDVTEYVLRDVLNLAMGNPDNHGRNTAIQKQADGTVRLSPLFDFAPMRIDPSGIPRVSRWGCMGRNDLNPDWRKICNVAAEGIMEPSDLLVILAEKIEFLRDLPNIASKSGVSDDVVRKACRRHNEIADSIQNIN